MSSDVQNRVNGMFEMWSEIPSTTWPRSAGSPSIKKSVTISRQQRSSDCVDIEIALCLQKIILIQSRLTTLQKRALLTIGMRRPFKWGPQICMNISCFHWKKNQTLTPNFPGFLQIEFAEPSFCDWEASTGAHLTTIPSEAHVDSHWNYCDLRYHCDGEHPNCKCLPNPPRHRWGISAIDPTSLFSVPRVRLLSPAIRLPPPSSLVHLGSCRKRHATQSLKMSFWSGEWGNNRSGREQEIIRILTAQTQRFSWN
jgi:hypothetical protein